jgi:hypothetical protein
VPASEFPELEAARAAHETALEEHVSAKAKRTQNREQERQLHEHLAAVQQAQRETHRESEKVVKQAALEALGVVAEHADEWLAKIAAERAEALAEHDDLLARANAAKARAHKNDAVESWLKQAASENVPQPFKAPVAA